MYRVELKCTYIVEGRAKMLNFFDRIKLKLSKRIHTKNCIFKNEKINIIISLIEWRTTPTNCLHEDIWKIIKIMTNYTKYHITNDIFCFNYFNFFCQNISAIVSNFLFKTARDIGIIQRQIWMNLEKSVFLLFPNIHAKSLLYIQQ